MARKPSGIDASAPPPERTAPPSHSRIRQDNGAFRSIFKTSFQEVQDVSFRKHLFQPLPPAPPVTTHFIQSGEDRFREAFRLVMRHEGKAYVHRDGVESSKMGMLQSTARSLGYNGNIKNLTMADAEALYRKLWDKSGAASLPYPLSIVHFDTYVNSPSAARRMLKESGGDIDTYLSLRANRYQRLATLRPQRFGRYINGWMNRVASLKTYVAAVETPADSRTTIAAAAKRKTIT